MEKSIFKIIKDIETTEEIVSKKQVNFTELRVGVTLTKTKGPLKKVLGIYCDVQLFIKDGCFVSENYDHEKTEFFIEDVSVDIGTFRSSVENLGINVDRTWFEDNYSSEEVDEAILEDCEIIRLLNLTKKQYVK